MLTQQLKELERYGIIFRKVYPSVPPMVEYSLTETGLELIPILEAMDKWGKKYVETYNHIMSQRENANLDTTEN